MYMGNTIDNGNDPVCINLGEVPGGGIQAFSLMKEFSAWVGRGFNSAEEFMIWSELTYNAKQVYADVMSRPTRMLTIVSF